MPYPSYHSHYQFSLWHENLGGHIEYSSILDTITIAAADDVIQSSAASTILHLIILNAYKQSMLYIFILSQLL